MSGITPDNITELAPDEVFVFGSNLSGIHGKGAAKTALQWGARRGVGIGRSGQTYAIPTRGLWDRRRHAFADMALDQIGEHIYDFMRYAHDHPEDIFLVTKIGCGYAQKDVAVMAALFGCVRPVPANVALPKEFWPFCKDRS